MEKFSKEPELLRHFSSDEDFRIFCIGYNDFNTLKGAYVFYTQKFYTWHFVISGKGRLEMADKTYHIGQGDMFFVPPDTMMRYFPEDDDPWEYVWISSVGDKMGHYGKLLGFSLETAVIKCASFQRVRHILKSIFDNTSSGEMGYYGVLSEFYKIIDICTTHTPKDTSQTIKELIDNNFTTASFHIEYICENIGFSHSQILRIFKNAYNITPSLYLSKKRIELAKELLIKTDLSVRSVAYSCGFTDEFYFMKCFRKHTGFTALTYRKLYK